MPYFPMSEYLDNDLHAVLSIGVDLIDEEVRGMLGYAPFQQKWQDFASTVREINEETTEGIAEELRTKFESACNALPVGLENSDP